MKTWLTIANASLCRIYHFDKKDFNLDFLMELSNPAAKLKGADLITDKPGHYKTDKASRGAYETKTPQEIKKEHFAKEIAKQLNSELKRNQYHDLILVAESQMNGKILQNLDKQVNQCIIHNIQKDYNNWSDHEIKIALKEQLQKLRS